MTNSDAHHRTNMPPKISGNIPVEQLGRPGAQSTLQIVPQFPGHSSSDQELMNDTSPRPFLVTGLLSRLPTAITPGAEIKSTFAPEDGTSYLLALRGASRMQFTTSFGQFYIKLNPSGEFFTVEYTCIVTSATEARRSFIDSINPTLDHLSYKYDVPVFMENIRVLDEQHQIPYVFVVSPFRNATVVDDEQIIPLELSPVYAMYREGICASSYFYKFLCFYKIIEGLFGKMRSNIYIRAKQIGVELINERSSVPNDPDIPSDIKCHVGSPIKEFFDKVLTDQFRNAVAHLQTQDGVLDVGSSAELDRYAGLSFVTGLCARELIAGHERLLAQLPMDAPI